jgi:hypothetical protein
VAFVSESELSGVRVLDFTGDDDSGYYCGTTEYPLLRTINYALRNNKTRPILTETKSPGLLTRNMIVL